MLFFNYTADNGTNKIEKKNKTNTNGYKRIKKIHFTKKSIF